MLWSPVSFPMAGFNAYLCNQIVHADWNKLENRKHMSPCVLKPCIRDTYLCMCMCINTHKHTRMHAHKHTRAQTHAHTNARASIMHVNVFSEGKNNGPGLCGVQ